MLCACGEPIETPARGPAPTACLACRMAQDRVRRRARDAAGRTARGPVSIWETRPELLAGLMSGVAEGLPYSAIAKRLGISRNAVIAKAFRAGISKPRPRRTTGVDPIEPRGWGRVARRVAVAPKPAPAGPSTDPGMLKALRNRDAPMPEGQRRGVADLDEGQCRWPIGDPQHADFHFCAADRLPGMSYCAPHARRAYVPVGPSPLRRPIVRQKQKIEV